MTVTIPRFTLCLAGLYCFLAGLALGNAFAARDAGYSPLGAAAGALLALGYAAYLVWAATRPPQVRPVPRASRPPAT